MFSVHNSRAFVLLIFAVFALIRSNKSILQFPRLFSFYNGSYTSIYNESYTIIYGLFLCRGDVSSDTCQRCLIVATKDIANWCPSDKSAIIWYEYCMLRYSDVNFFGVLATLPRFFMYNQENNSRPDQTKFDATGLLNILVAGATATHTLFNTSSLAASDGSGQNYGMVQCTRDIDSRPCGECLNNLLTWTCCQSQKGWRMAGPNCNLRYEQYTSSLAPAPAPATATATVTPPGTGKIVEGFAAGKLKVKASFDLWMEILE
uniref:Gnk2-homologous domain-containing protein n=1 Tax=Fagus sylvatica TaxID=28930 RepID=A0A2N9IPB4_FAGSY